MAKILERITVLGLEWDVEFEYYPGTNSLITSQSLEPNEDPELEVLNLTPVEDMSDELFEFIIDNADEMFENACWELVQQDYEDL